MKYLYLLFFIFISCHLKQAYNHVSLKPLGTINIKSADKHYPFAASYSNIFCLHTATNNDYFIRIDCRIKKAGYSNLFTAKLNEEQSLNGFIHLLNQYSCIGCQVINWDTIFLITESKPQQLLLVDSSGTIKNSWFLNGKFEKEFHTFISFSESSPLLWMPKSKQIFIDYHSPMVCDNYNYALKDYWTDNMFYNFTLLPNHQVALNYSFGNVPKDFRKFFVSIFDKQCVVGFNHKMLYSYSQNPDVEIFDEGKFEKSIRMSTDNFKPFTAQFDNNKLGNIDYMEDYLNVGDYCFQLIANSAADYAIRIISIHQQRFLDNGTMNVGKNPPWAISVLDSSFQNIGSIYFPKDSVDLTHVYLCNRNEIIIKSYQHENLFYKYQIVAHQP